MTIAVGPSSDGGMLATLTCRIHQTTDVRSLVEVVIAELGPAPGVCGVAVVDHDRSGAPTLWLGDTRFDPARVQAYLDGGHRHDPALARVLATRAPARLQRLVHEPARFAETWGHADPHADLWVLPIFSGDAVIGTLRVVASEPPCDLVLVAAHVSIRLAALGIDSLASCEPIRLTNRQREIAWLVARGCTNAEIGNMLGCTSHAIKKQLSRVLALLEVSNRAELAALAGRWSAPAPAAPRPRVIVASRAA